MNSNLNFSGTSSAKIVFVMASNGRTVAPALVNGEERLAGTAVVWRSGARMGHLNQSKCIEALMAAARSFRRVEEIVVFSDILLNSMSTPPHVRNPILYPAVNYSARQVVENLLDLQLFCNDQSIKLYVMTRRRLCTQTACQGLERHIPNCGRRHSDDLNQALRRLDERRQRDHEQPLFLIDGHRVAPAGFRDAYHLRYGALVECLGIARNHVVGGREAVRQDRRSRQVVLQRQRARNARRRRRENLISNLRR